VPNRPSPVAVVRGECAIDDRTTMPIHPLPQFEADLEEDRKLALERLKPPRSIVVRFGVMRLIAEYPYDGQAKPGCGSKLVVRTHRGTELAEMLTSTCPNAGCGHALTRRDLLRYIEHSGGKDYPFFTEGRVLRVATPEDLNRQAALDARRPDLVRRARAVVERLHLSAKMKVVEAEPLLGGERITFYFFSEERVDFRGVVMELAQELGTRIEMRQVGARDEARLVADYEKCGQHCCCRQFLKVLKPVPMKNAKIQKATLDPLKISGRCGRLMCCLRYEESTYEDLRRNLPRKKTRVLTPDGPGIVLDAQILTQLVLVELEGTGEQAAYPVESLQRPDPGARTPGARGDGRDDDDAEDTDDGPSAEGAGGCGPRQSPPGGRGSGGGRSGGGAGGDGGGRGLREGRERPKRPDAQRETPVDPGRERPTPGGHGGPGRGAGSRGPQDRDRERAGGLVPPSAFRESAPSVAADGPPRVQRGSGSPSSGGEGGTSERSGGREPLGPPGS
jgi:cell fate regulator YaaT (PSP1 superfamily)